MLRRVILQNLEFYSVVTKQLSKLFNFIKIKMPYYAVAKGRTAGIFMTWPDCEAQVKGFPGARYKKFNTVVEAQDFISTAGNSIVKKSAKSVSNPSFNNDYSNQSLKRSFSTSSTTKQKNEIPKKKPKSKSKRKSYSDSDSDMSDQSDDLNTIICKQMDDIEKRLKGFEKGVDKIIKKNIVKLPGRKTILIEQQRDLPASYTKDNDGFVQVFTDGACSANGRTGAKAGLGVYWGNNHPWNKSEPVSGRATNNCGEIQAATCAIKTALQNGVTKLCINTDSKFLINSVTKWMPGWKRKGWKLQSGEPVKNEIDFKELDLLQNHLQIKWNYVEAHQGVHGNEMADQLAKAGAAMYNK